MDIRQMAENPQSPIAIEAEARKRLTEVPKNIADVLKDVWVIVYIQ